MNQHERHDPTFTFGEPARYRVTIRKILPKEEGKCEQTEEVYEQIVEGLNVRELVVFINKE